MAMTFKTLSPKWTPAQLVDISNNDTETVRLFRVDRRQADVVTNDLSGGIAQSMSCSTNGEVGLNYPLVTVSGPARSLSDGQDVVVNCYASERCSVTFEDSADGASWGNPATFELSPGVSYGLRSSTSLAYYRAGGKSVNAVHVVPQLRDSNG
jgi:hypothetical protein